MNILNINNLLVRLAGGNGEKIAQQMEELSTVTFSWRETSQRGRRLRENNERFRFGFRGSPR